MSDELSSDRLSNEELDYLVRVWDVVYDLTEVIPKQTTGRWDGIVVDKINELLIDAGWQFMPAHAIPAWTGAIDRNKAIELFELGINLRLALQEWGKVRQDAQCFFNDRLEKALDGRTGCGSGYKLKRIL